MKIRSWPYFCEINLGKAREYFLYSPAHDRHFTGTYIKIGSFADDTGILYQHEIHGRLFKQINTVIDLQTIHSHHILRQG